MKDRRTYQDPEDDAPENNRIERMIDEADYRHDEARDAAYEKQMEEKP